MVSARRCFTQYWLNSLFLGPLRRTGELRYAASSLLLKRGAAPGDLIYIVTVRRGSLFLAGRMEIDAICDRAVAEDRLGPDLWPAAFYALARPETATPRWSDLLVPPATVEQLRFVGKAGPVGLRFVAPHRLDPQTLRGMRELTAGAATLLDRLVDRRIRADAAGPAAP